jgi:HK97 family phage major capsid protein
MPAPTTITLSALGGMKAAELRAAIEQLDDEITKIHLSESGEIRTDLSATESSKIEAKLILRTRAEAHLVARNQFERHPGSVERAYQGLGGTLVAGGNPFADGGDVMRASDQDVRTRALRGLERRGKDLPADQVDQMDSLLRMAIGRDQTDMDGSMLARRLLISESEAYRSAWTQIMQNPHPILTAEEAEAVRALQRLDAWESRGMAESSGAVGAFGLPVLIDPSIMLTSGAAAAPVLNICRQVPSNTNVWKGVSSAPPTFSWDTEGTAVSDDSPTLAQPSISVYTARGFIPYTLELGMDYPDFSGEMSRMLEQGWVDAVAAATVTGSGTGQPFGIFTKLDATAASEVVVTTFGQLGAVDVFKVWNQLPERFRSRATWLMSVSAESQIRSFSSANQSSAYFTTDLGADGLSRLNGRPVAVTDYAPTFTAGSAGHQNYVTVGDFSGYVWVRRMNGMQVEPIQHLFDTTTGRPLGQRGFFAFSRAGGDASVTQAFRLLNTT